MSSLKDAVENSHSEMTDSINQAMKIMQDAKNKAIHDNFAKVMEHHKKAIGKTYSVITPPFDLGDIQHKDRLVDQEMMSKFFDLKCYSLYLMTGEMIDDIILSSHSSPNNMDLFSHKLNKDSVYLVVANLFEDYLDQPVSYENNQQKLSIEELDINKVFVINID